MYMLKYLGSFHRVNLFCWCVFARLMHPASKFDKAVLRKCGKSYRIGQYEPLGEYLSR